MRLTFRFTKEGVLRLPLFYNHLIQGMIYDNLDQSLANDLHDKGFSYEKRSFKLFTFSRILGRYRLIDDKIEIISPFRLVVSSPVEEILRSLAENLVRKSEINFGSDSAFLEAVNVHFAPEISEDIVIRMLSPVTTYSTLTAGDGKKKTYYYNPYEKEFSELIRRNLVKKYVAIYEKEPQSKEFEIIPIGVKLKDEKIIKYKGFIIKAWMGKFRIRGNPELIKLAYDTGLGSKNSQGFGCFEMG